MTTCRYPHILALALPLMFALNACGGGSDQAADVDPETGLTTFQLEHGIGPITEAVVVGAIDDVLADSGAASYNMKCAACHKLDERYVGPPLRGVTGRRSPAYIMNMILNPDEMIKTHPEARKLLAEFMTMMPNQNIQEAEARALLEHLRRSDAEAPIQTQ